MPMTALARGDLVDRLRGRLPGAAAPEEGLRLKQGVVAEPGQPVGVKANGFDQRFGLVRPFALGDVDVTGSRVLLNAVVCRGVLTFPSFASELMAAQRALDALVTQARAVADRI
jgi:hypothetical protein